MPKRQKASAADLMRLNDAHLKVVLAELEESTTVVRLGWPRALELVDSDPEKALEALVDIQIQLRNFARLEVLELLRLVVLFSNRLDKELPDAE